MFLERSSSVDALTVSDWFGLVGGFHSDYLTLAASIFTTTITNLNPGAPSGGNDKYSYSARVTGVPLQGDKGLVHLGAGYQLRNYNVVSNDGSAVANWSQSVGVELRGRATFPSLLTLSVTDRLKQLRVLDLEFAAEYQGLLVQGEYLKSKNKFVADQTPSQDITGWYAEAGLIVTGERRGYDFRTAAFSDPKPAHSYGAWEIAVRHTRVDAKRTNGTNVPAVSGAINNGGVLYAWSGGVNWFVTSKLKFQFNVVRSKFSYALSNDPHRVIRGYGVGLQYLF